jgi:hypothetical protein
MYDADIAHLTLAHVNAQLRTLPPLSTRVLWLLRRWR